MKRIIKLSDVNSTQNISQCLKGYVLNIISFLCQQYDCSDISAFGAFFILETKKDVQDYASVGLDKPLNEVVFEHVEIVTIEEIDESITFVNALVLLDADYGIEIFADVDLLSEEIMEKMLSAYSTERIIINVQKSKIHNERNSK